MNQLIRKRNNRSGFTIVELLTVMSIIVLLISLLVPSLNRVKIYALYVKQRNHFKSIDTALEMFNAEWEGYPDSDGFDYSGLRYCGAMKLCEAMVGQDLLGFHPESRFRQDGFNGLKAPEGKDLYPARRVPLPLPNVVEESERERKGLYISRDNANSYKMSDIFDPMAVQTTFGPDSPTLPVLCDVYGRALNRDTGKNIGMPILYYKADTTKQRHDSENPGNSIYNYTDNIDLINLDLPFQPGFTHPMASRGVAPIGDPPMPASPEIFYEITRNKKMPVPKPYREDSYILISAGFDGLYGTPDDVFDFEK